MTVPDIVPLTVPCNCSRLPFNAAVPDKVFPFQLCSMHLFLTSIHCSCSRQNISIPALFHASVPDFYSIQLFQTKVFLFQCYSMHLLQTSVPCSCSRQIISVQALIHASVRDFRSMQLFQTKFFRSSSVPCICS